ncbi:SCO7613 C-terminal domain-containing membrane protein [Nocardioides yefusunii]|uniref:SCO7613 C-terminal domain-containing membrane protein n=1 Tax=Nocardioides yefusunii TaxID=2500546 RepID=A0ABW1R0G5_9ACTN|nr:hypothetical protein [Nocardioides yefusunii]
MTTSATSSGDDVRAPDGLVYGTAHAPFTCPGCWARVAAGTSICPRCHTRFTGALAGRLWWLEGNLDRLAAERERVAAEAGRTRHALMQESGTVLDDRPAASAAPAAPAAPRASTVVPPLPPTRYPATPYPTTVGAQASSTWGGQQLLLALGGFLLLSGSAFFLAVIWDLIGLTGQAIVMAVLTLSAAGSARAATRRGLGAAAETAACLALGLLVLDVVAARNLGLWGLDDVDGALYFGAAALGSALLITGFDLIVPTRRAVVYRPVAALLAAGSAWSLYSLGDEARLLQVSAVALVVGLWGGLVALAAQAYERFRGSADGAAKPRLGAPAWLALILGGLSVATHWFLALVVAYGPSGDDSRWLATLVLVPLPAAVLVGCAVLRRRGVALDPTWWWLAGIALAAVVGVPIWAAPRGWLLGVAVVVAVALVVLVIAPGLVAPARASARHLELAAHLLGFASAGLWLLLLVLDGSGATSMPALLDGEEYAGEMAWWAPAVPVAGLLVTAVVRALRSVNATGWVAASWVLAGVGLATSMRQQSLEDALLPTTALAVAALVAATLTALAERRGAATSGGDVEALHLGAAAVYGLVALVAAGMTGQGELQVVAAVLAAGLVLHACAPRRLFSADIAVALVAGAVVLELAEADVDLVEAYFVVPMLGWLAVGIVRKLTGGARSSWAVVGVPIMVGLYPSLLISLVGDDDARTLLVTLGAVILLLAGCAYRWMAPVVLGAVALGVVGWTWGGMWVSYVPGWINLTVAGAVLLTVGVCWESAVKAGRAGSHWVSSLW